MCFQTNHLTETHVFANELDYGVGLREILYGLVEFEKSLADVEQNQRVLYLEGHDNDIHEVQGTIVDWSFIAYYSRGILTGGRQSPGYEIKGR